MRNPWGYLRVLGLLATLSSVAPAMGHADQASLSMSSGPTTAKTCRDAVERGRILVSDGNKLTISLDYFIVFVTIEPEKLSCEAFLLRNN